MLALSTPPHIRVAVVALRGGIGNARTGPGPRTGIKAPDTAGRGRSFHRPGSSARLSEAPGGFRLDGGHPRSPRPQEGRKASASQGSVRSSALGAALRLSAAFRIGAALRIGAAPSRAEDADPAVPASRPTAWR